MGPKSAHNSGPRASPSARIWHAPSYRIRRGFAVPKGTQFELNEKVLSTFGGVIKVPNPINRKFAKSLCLTSRQLEYLSSEG